MNTDFQVFKQFLQCFTNTLLQ